MTSTASPPDVRHDPPRPRPRTNQLRLLFAALAAVFFATPLVLIIAGVGPRSFENRRLAPAPKLADGWNFFDDATRYLIDRLPLRYQAVHANTWIDRHIFAMTPQYGQNGLGGVANDQALPFTGKPQQDQAAVAGAAKTRTGGKAVQAPATAVQVTPGLHGWYYLQGVFDRACLPFTPFPDALARWEQFMRMIRDSGRRVELIVAPDKSTIYPEYAAPSTPNLKCGLAGTNALWRLLESPAAAKAGIVPLRKPLLALKAVSPVPIYYKTDSHWNNVGSATMIENALPPLSAKVRVQPSDNVSTGETKYSGDLLALLGQPGSEIAPTQAIKRVPGAPVVPGHTTLVGDSYADAALPQMQPYFASLTYVPWLDSTAKQVADGIAAGHNVVLEIVEREFDFHAWSKGYFTPQFMELVRKTLAAHPLKP